uniref:PH domain-containing protein n=1 Tax=Haptolina ericina TaxID=156174 RepID=A0A7S3EYH3_9EUKA
MEGNIQTPRGMVSQEDGGLPTAPTASSESPRAAAAAPPNVPNVPKTPQLAPPLPQSGYLWKQSGGKLDKGRSVGNVVAKWDKRWFSIDEGSTKLMYHKSPRDKASGKAPAGAVECVGCSVERITEALPHSANDFTFCVTTRERVLTMRAESHQDVQAWIRAVIAGGGWAEAAESWGRTSEADEAPRQSLRPAPDTSGSQAGSQTGVGGGGAGSASGSAKDSSGEMPGMEGYLSKQSGGKTGGNTRGEVLKKWDRRYFVLRAGTTFLRYYKVKEDFSNGREPAGSLDTSGGVVKVEREPGIFAIHIVTPLRTLSLRAESAAILEHWIMALSCGDRAKQVERISYGGDSPRGSPSPKLASSPNPLSKIEAGRPVKVLLVGDAGVGKTCVLQRFAEGTFVSSTRATVGMDLKRTLVDLDGSGERLTLQIWDTAGQEMFRSIIASYYRGAHGVLLMFDVSRAKTFDNLEGWLTEVRSKCTDGVVIILVGNKLDTETREVPYETAATWAKKRGLPYVETSAKRGVMINDAFITLVATIAGRAGELSTLLKRAKVLTASAPPSAQLDITKLPPKPTGGGGCAC